MTNLSVYGEKYSLTNFRNDVLGGLLGGLGGKLGEELVGAVATQVAQRSAGATASVIEREGLSVALKAETSAGETLLKWGGSAVGQSAGTSIATGHNEFGWGSFGMNMGLSGLGHWVHAPRRPAGPANPRRSPRRSPRRYANRARLLRNLRQFANRARRSPRRFANRARRWSRSLSAPARGPQATAEAVVESLGGRNPYRNLYAELESMMTARRNLRTAIEQTRTPEHVGYGYTRGLRAVELMTAGGPLEGQPFATCWERLQALEAQRHLEPGQQGGSPLRARSS